MRFASIVALLLCVPVTARAVDPGCEVSDRPVIELAVEVEPPDQIIADNLAAHLRAELAARDIDLCTKPSGRAPITYVKLRVTRNGSSVRARIEIVDQITDKRVERTIELGTLPADTRPTVVAAATDELLRVSWTELTIGDAPAPKIDPPTAVVRAVETQPRVRLRAPSDRFALGVEATSTVFFGHRTALGLGAWAAIALSKRFALGVRLGGEHGVARDGTDGSVRADALLGGTSVRWTVARGIVGARLAAGIDFLRVHFVGTPTNGAMATDAAAVTSVASAGGLVFLRTGPIETSLGAAVLGALRPVHARDSQGATVTSVEGVGAGFTFAIGGWF